MHRLPDDNEDYAPFQIDYLDLGVQAKQLQRIRRLPEPPVDWRYPPPLATSSGTLPSIA